MWILCLLFINRLSLSFLQSNLCSVDHLHGDMMNHKESAISFLKLASSGEVHKAYEQFVSPKFIHHNPYYRGDRESLMTGMIEAHKASPNKSIDIKYVYEDKNTVITHSLVTRVSASQQGVAVVHIFRFENGQIAELWDLGLLIEKDMVNDNGLF
jgi:predicted SnoaL-like aldol condensation-catalyzing enzyme